MNYEFVRVMNSSTKCPYCTTHGSGTRESARFSREQGLESEKMFPGPRVLIAAVLKNVLLFQEASSLCTNKRKSLGTHTHNMYKRSTYQRKFTLLWNSQVYFSCSFS